MAELSPEEAQIVSKYLGGITAVHNSSDLPLILGNTKQAREYLSRVGEWNTNEKAKQQGMYSDDFWAWMSTGTGYNPKDKGEDGSFVDIFSMKSPFSSGYLLYPVLYAFDKIREVNKPSEASDDVKKFVNDVYADLERAAQQAAERARSQAGPRYEEQMRQTNSRIDNFWYQALPRFAAVDKMMEDGEQSA